MATKQAEIKKLAIANRGEIAVRIIEACRELDIKTVLLHSEADTNSMAFRMSDEQVCVGPAPVEESYLNISRNIQCALSKGCDAIHPGIGFLSESFDFAQACERSGLVFVGPQPETIRSVGDKRSARRLMEQAGIPIVPGYHGDDQSEKRLLEEAHQLGFPVVIKVAEGGGGRGMKVAREEKEFSSQLQAARREGRSLFGSDSVILEKYLDHVKHIEVQIFGDLQGNHVHLFERECSLQRRHQKIIEESPSSSITQDIKEKMFEASLYIAGKVRYVSAGTVEFLSRDNEFFFLEMNPRLQVEHPVTEMVLGVDIVKAQVQIAQGMPCPWGQEKLQPRGHSIECRIYAENPYKNGVPSRGVLGSTNWPHGPGRRFDVGFERGDDITSYYDPILAKSVVWDETRLGAISKAEHVLQEIVVFGVHTNIPFLQEIMRHKEFRTGDMTTRFLQDHFPKGLEGNELSEDDIVFAQKVFDQIPSIGTNQMKPGEKGPISPWYHDWDLK